MESSSKPPYPELGCDKQGRNISMMLFIVEHGYVEETTSPQGTHFYSP